MKPRVLYIASGGINEPLIVSQVLRYLRRLETVFEICHLITLQRSTPANAEEIRQELATHNIHWHAVRSDEGLRVFNLWREIFRGCKLGKQLINQHQLNLIHSRSFVPGNIGLCLARKTKTKFLYDMRGFWAEEKKAKGTIKSTPLFRIAGKMERRLFNGADALVSLTYAGKEKLRDDGIATPIHVIPCCADTALFVPPGGDQPCEAAHSKTNPIRLISVGSLGPGYLPEAVFGLFQATLSQKPDSTLQLLSRSDKRTIQNVAEQSGCDWNQVQLTSASPTAVVDYLQNSDVGLCMIQPSDAKIASSPTKLAEYLACGLPVVANADQIGDVGDILTQNRVGVVVESLDEAGYTNAVRELLNLLKDPELKKRCRETAADQFSVDVAVSRYSVAYQSLLSDH